MRKLFAFFRRPIVVNLEQIKCQEGDTVFLATRTVLGCAARRETRAQLTEIARAKGVEFTVFDGVSFLVVSGKAP